MDILPPCVSIGLPVYNGERFLEEAISSILAQTYTDFELIISDNASIDRTQEICEAYATKDRRIRYYRNVHNLGAAWNYNRTFELCQSKYFKWAAHDDLCAQEMLRLCVDVLDQNSEVVICYFKSKIIDEHGNIVQDYPNGPNMLSERPNERFVQYVNSVTGKWHPIFGLIRSNILKKTRLIGNYIGSDTCLLAELSLYGKFFQIPECLFFRRIHPGNMYMKRNMPEWLEFFDPKLAGKMAMPRWRMFFENLVSIKNAPINIYEKYSLFEYLARRIAYDIFRGNKHYTKELRSALKHLLIKYCNLSVKN
jgi:glycosyltransferase involved in cell wall biosynthesis